MATTKKLNLEKETETAEKPKRKPRATTRKLTKKVAITSEKKTRTTTSTRKKESEVSSVQNVTRETPTKKVLGELPVTTEMYTGADIDELLEANKLIEDEDIPGDFYVLSMKSGRLIIRKVQEHS